MPFLSFCTFLTVRKIKRNKDSRELFCILETLNWIRFLWFEDDCLTLSILSNLWTLLFIVLDWTKVVCKGERVKYSHSPLLSSTNWNDEVTCLWHSKDIDLMNVSKGLASVSSVCEYLIQRTPKIKLRR